MKMHEGFSILAGILKYRLLLVSTRMLSEVFFFFSGAHTEVSRMWGDFGEVGMGRGGGR